MAVICTTNLLIGLLIGIKNYLMIQVMLGTCRWLQLGNDLPSGRNPECLV